MNCQDMRSAKILPIVLFPAPLRPHNKIPMKIPLFSIFCFCFNTTLSYQKNICQAIINNNCNQIIYRGDQRAGSHRRIHLNFVEKHGDNRSNQTGNDHRNNKCDSHTSGYGKCTEPCISFGKMDIDAEQQSDP